MKTSHHCEGSLATTALANITPQFKNFSPLPIVIVAVMAGLIALVLLVPLCLGIRNLCDKPKPTAVNAEEHQGPLRRTWIGVSDYGAPPWSQAWGWGSQASAWWPGLCPTGPGRAQPEMATWARLPVGSPPAGKVHEGPVQCGLGSSRGSGGGLDGPIPRPKLCSSWGGRSLSLSSSAGG
ncbi:hypothetical protein L3Q82_006555 [Scortum barcoo]|uniref:Uncharacterized protein n=1 Tax=Scortum barcoo TaxID=214431 RepID=A0ACB8WZK1_9TELE|nr:hypothetical protein L3Q82_006555 [Scortum barcoo]